MAPLDLPRVAAQQALAGLPVTSPAMLAPGDLVHFDEGDGYVEHIGIYLGDGEFAHAPRRGDVVKVSSLEDAFYSEAYLGARRLAPGGAGLEAPPAGGGTFGELAAVGPPTRPTGPRWAGWRPRRRRPPSGACWPTRAGRPGPASLPGRGRGPGGRRPLDGVGRRRTRAPARTPRHPSLTESSLRSLAYGDRDSLGRFQQRPSQGWGTPDQVMDPYHALGAFLHRAALADEGGRFSSGGVERLGAWAQAVQRSAFPERCQPRLAEARILIAG